MLVIEGFEANQTHYFDIKLSTLVLATSWLEPGRFFPARLDSKQA